ncbi:MAG: NYN domain-containing protein [Anaerolineae bacterium]|nr:NYN domain-containing protein [Anaerolineae bacterium]
MPYLIDGHNLIPKIAGLSLRSINDENQLIQKLQTFQRQSRKKVEVFFDGAPPGESGIRSIGGVKAHFVHRETTADSAIVKRLKKLGNDARNWTVVSSDRQVLAAARSSRASTLSSEAFAQLLGTTNEQAGQSASVQEEQISPAEVEEWLQLFRDKKNHNTSNKPLIE